MDERLFLVILALVLLAVVAAALKWRVIGVRGGAVERDEWPLVYWLAVTAALLASGAALLLAVLT
jgi:hypothetical protein